MLAADKQLLDARLRDELQQLRVAELGNVVLRFQNILTPSTLTPASFTAIVSSTSCPRGRSTRCPTAPSPSSTSPPLRPLPLPLVTTIASTGIIFGQRRRCSRQQSRAHDTTSWWRSSTANYPVPCGAMHPICVVVSAIAVVWVKQSYNDGEWHGTSITASTSRRALPMTSGACHAPTRAPGGPPLTRTQSERALPSETPRTPPAPDPAPSSSGMCAVTLMQMGLRLHTEGAHLDALARSSRADLGQRCGGDDGRVCTNSMWARGQARADLALAQQPHGTANGRPPDYTDTTRGRRPDERSALLPCMQR